MYVCMYVCDDEDGDDGDGGYTRRGIVGSEMKNPRYR